MATQTVMLMPGQGVATIGTVHDVFGAVSVTGADGVVRAVLPGDVLSPGDTVLGPGSVSLVLDPFDSAPLIDDDGALLPAEDLLSLSSTPAPAGAPTALSITPASGDALGIADLLTGNAHPGNGPATEHGAFLLFEPRPGEGSLPWVKVEAFGDDSAAPVTVATVPGVSYADLMHILASDHPLGH